MQNDFLFELGCEELPSKAVIELAQAFSSLMTEALEKQELKYKTLKTYSSPRRIAVLIESLDEKSPDKSVVKRGPALNAAFDNDKNPTKALLGFAASCQVDISALKPLETDKGGWIIYEQHISGQSVDNIMPDIIRQSLEKLPIAKPMRWGDGLYEFVRPVHWAVMLFGDKVIESEFYGVISTSLSYGHRYLHPDSVKINHPNEYVDALREAFVMVEFEERRQTILNQIAKIADQHQAKARLPDELVNEVCSIVEWPNAQLATFEQRFLEVPAEALIASMESHQKSFALMSESGALLPKFIFVSNLIQDNPSSMIYGNQKVMHARLSDAAFFYQEDRKKPLSAYLESTKNVIFQEKLGTLFDKTERIKALLIDLSNNLNIDKNLAVRAATLSRCDLMTGMVNEFPELQGLMGYYYAKADQEDSSVAIALNEQYMPRFSADILPKGNLGIALSLADRIDTMVGIFAIGLKPTGVKDPFKLRRHALAIIRIIIESRLSLSLTGALKSARTAYQSTISISDEVLIEVKQYIIDRLQAYYHEQGIDSSILEAALSNQNDDLYDMDLRIKSIYQMMGNEDLKLVAAACKRVGNMLQCAKDEIILEQPSTSKFIEVNEQVLYAKIKEVKDFIFKHSGNYSLILERLASLSQPMNEFFLNVMVLVEDADVRQNRLSLLQLLHETLTMIADIGTLKAD